MSEGNVKENILRDSRYPVHAIADKLLPYLKILVEKFEPEQVVLFGSFRGSRSQLVTLMCFATWSCQI
jgi:hypothetical protein